MHAQLECDLLWRCRPDRVTVCPSDLLQALPLLTERQYVSAVHSRLMDGQPWKLPGLQAVCRLAWALALRVLSQLPQGSGEPAAWVRGRVRL